jgi:heme O synthase-like polyprenyltransferase
MSITFLLSAFALVAVLALFAAIFIGGIVYVVRMKRQGTEATLVGARKRRELRQS